MELYEGGQYRIDIVGADSSIIVDSQTGKISADITDTSNNVVVDAAAGRFYGTLLGSVVDSESNTAYNPDTRQFYGKFNGPVMGANGESILNDNRVTVPLQANIQSEDGRQHFNLATETFIGKFNGDLVNTYGSIILAMDNDEPILRTALSGNIYALSGVEIFDYETRNFKNASYQGDILNSSGSQIFDHTSSTFHGNFAGEIMDQNGTRLIDRVTGNYHGSLSGDIIGEETGLIRYSRDHEQFYGTFVGDIKSSNNQIVLSTSGTATLQANILDENGAILLDIASGVFHGSVDSPGADWLAGDILDPVSKDRIFDAANRTFDQQIHADVAGSLIGNLLSSNGDYAYDASANTFTAQRVIATQFDGHLDGTFQGNVVSQDGVLFDQSTKHWSNVSLSGYLFDYNGLEVFDPVGNTLSTRTLYSDNVICTDIDMDSLQIKSDGISVVVESIYSNPCLSGKFFRNINPNIPDWIQQGVRLEAVGGTWLSPESIEAGHKLPSIGWAAAIDVNEDYEDSTMDNMEGGEKFALVANIYGKVPDNAVFSTTAGDQKGSPGELVFQTQAQDYSVNYMILDSEGKLTTTLNEFKVSGETGVTPSNTSTPDSWLQATVNGETKFIPLYS